MTFVTSPPQDYFISAAKGSLPGTRTVTLVGENLDIDIGSPATAWSLGGLWVPIASPTTLSAVSTSPNDTLGGTGCNLIYVIGQDASGNTINEIINLNGTTPAVGAQNFSFVERVYVGFAGSLQVNEGTITVSAGGVAQASVPAGDSVSKSLIYRVPNGKRAALVQRLYSSAKLSGGGSPIVTFKYYVWTPQGFIVHATTTYIDTALQNENGAQILTPEFSPAGTTFEVRVETDVNNTAVHGILWFLEVDA